MTTLFYHGYDESKKIVLHLRLNVRYISLLPVRALRRWPLHNHPAVAKMQLSRSEKVGNLVWGFCLAVTKNFIGSGWKFPPQLDNRGRIELAHQEQDIVEAIKVILMTRKGERPMRPEFGSDLHTLVFAPNDAGTAGLAARFIQESLARWEPRIEVTDVIAHYESDEPALLRMEIQYTVLSTNSDRNLVFPFYTIPGE